MKYQTMARRAVAIEENTFGVRVAIEDGPKQAFSFCSVLFFSRAFSFTFRWNSYCIRSHFYVQIVWVLFVCLVRRLERDGTRSQKTIDDIPQEFIIFICLGMRGD